MASEERKAIGGYSLWGVAVALIFMLSLIALTPDLTDFTGFFGIGAVNVTKELNLTRTTFKLTDVHAVPIGGETSAAFTIPFPKDVAITSVTVSGTIEGEGKVRIILRSGVKNWTVFESGDIPATTSGIPVTGMVTGEVPVPEENITEQEPAEEPTIEITSTEEDMTEVRPEEMFNASFEEETLEQPVEQNVTEVQEEPPEENMTVPEENATSPEMNITIPEENVTVENFTEENITESYPANVTENMTTTPEVNVTVPENITGPENETEPEINITGPEEEPELNVTEPEENMTVPEENVTIPEDNVTVVNETNVTLPEEPELNVTAENVTEPEANLTLPENATIEIPRPLPVTFDDACKETCIMPFVEHAVLIVVIEGNATLILKSVKYTVQEEIEDGKIRDRTQMLKLIEHLNLTDHFLTSDFTFVNNIEFNITEEGYYLIFDIYGIPVKLDKESIKKLKPGTLKRFTNYETEVRVILKTNDASEFLMLEEKGDKKNTAKTEKLNDVKTVSKENFENKFNMSADAYEEKLLLDTGKGNPFPVEQVIDGYVSVVMGIRDIAALAEAGGIDVIAPDKEFFTGLHESINITSTNKVHDLGYNGEGRKVCVVDTGLNPSAVGLTDGVNAFGYNFVDDNTDYSDGYQSHGTKVTYAITSIAPKATVYMAKVIDDTGIGYASDVEAALDWCAQNGVDMVSMSIGEGGYQGYCDDVLVARKVMNLSASGTIVVAATGNNLFTSAVANPACASSSVRVAASRKDDVFWMLSNYNNATLLVAPGMDIETVDMYGQAVNATGTSMSAALVSGITALLLENRTLTPNETWDLLVHTGDVTSYFDDRTGQWQQFARVNAWNALTGNVTNNLTEGALGDGMNGTWAFETAAYGDTGCTYGSQCSPYYCVIGTCRYCDYDSGLTPQVASAFGCSPPASSVQYPGTCYDSTPEDQYGTYGCGTSGVVRMDCESGGVASSCDQFADDTFLSCTTTSGDSCDSTISGDAYWSQNGICASGATNSCDTSGEVAYCSSTYYSACSSCNYADTCDSTITSGDYSANGVCGSTSHATCCTSYGSAPTSTGPTVCGTETAVCDSEDGYYCDAVNDGSWSPGAKRCDADDNYCDNCASYVGEDADCEVVCGASSQCDERDPSGWWCSSNVVTAECTGTNGCVYSTSGGDVGTCEYADSYDSNCGGASQCDENNPNTCSNGAPPAGYCSTCTLESTESSANACRCYVCGTDNSAAPGSCSVPNDPWDASGWPGDISDYCCEDAGGGYIEYFNVYPSNPGEGSGKLGGDDSADDACCDDVYDCVYSGTCYTDNTYYDLDSDGRNDYLCYNNQEPSWWINVDYHTSYCTGNGFHWNVGAGDADVEGAYYTTTGSRTDYCTIGSGGTPSIECCCGDDTGEEYLYQDCDNAYACTDDTGDDACCDSVNDCVDGATCYTSGTDSASSIGGSTGTNDVEYCSSGIWYDCANTGDCTADPIGFTIDGEACASGECAPESCTGNDCYYCRNNGYLDCDNDGDGSGQDRRCCSDHCFRDEDNDYDAGACDTASQPVCDASSGSDQCIPANACGYDSGCDSSSINDYVTDGATTADVDCDGDNDYCSAGIWYDCSTDSQCPSGYYCSSNDCVVCTSAQCATHSNCRDGTAGCCDQHSECPTGYFCFTNAAVDESATTTPSDDSGSQANNVQLASRYVCSPAKYFNRGTEASNTDSMCLNTKYTRTQTYNPANTCPHSDSDWWQFSGDGPITAEEGYLTSETDYCFVWNYDPCTGSDASILYRNGAGTLGSLGTQDQGYSITSGCSSNWLWINFGSGTYGSTVGKNVLGGTNGNMQVMMEVSAGDYVREWQFGWRKDESGATDGSNSYWCCDASTDCVDDAPSQGSRVSGDPDTTASGCYNTAATHDTGGGDGADLEYCGSGTWYAADAGSSYCTAVGATWATGGDAGDAPFGGYTTGTETECCEDDSGENYLYQDCDNAYACTDDAGDDACCAAGTDCVNAGTCFNTGTSTEDVNGNGDDEYCSSGIWYDCTDTGDCDPTGEYANGESSQACSGGTECTEACTSNDCIYLRNNGWSDCDLDAACVSGSCIDDAEITAARDGNACDNTNDGTNGHLCGPTGDMWDVCVPVDGCIFDSDWDNAFQDCYDGGLGGECAVSDGDTSHDLDNDGDNDYCSSGTWYDCNTDSECDTASGYTCNATNDCTLSCSTGDDCPGSFFCVNVSGGSGMCDDCDGSSGRGCSDDSESPNTRGTCYDDGAAAFGCDTTDPIMMSCDAGGCNPDGDASYATCTTDSGDSCMSSVGGDFSQDGTCASGGANNCDTSGIVALNGATYYSECQADLDAADSDATSGGDFSQDSICCSGEAVGSASSDCCDDSDCASGTYCSPASFTCTAYAPPRYEVVPGTLSGVLGYWNFNEGSGSQVYDMAGRHNGTVIGAAWTDGYSGKALYFDGISTYDSVEIGYDEYFAVPNYTVSLWVKIPAAQSGSDTLVTRRADSPNWDRMTYRFNVYNGQLFFETVDSSNTIHDMYSSDYDLRDNLWHHVAAAYNGTHKLLFIDGVMVNATVAGVPDITPPQLLEFGEDPYGDSNNLRGTMDEIQIYDRALAEDEIYEIYYGAATKSVSFYDADESLVLYMPFEEGSGTKAEDWSVNNNDGTIINAIYTNGDTGFGGAMNFSGSGDRINLTNTTLNPNSNNWSVCMWFNWSGASGENILINKEDLYEIRVSGGYVNYAWQPYWNWVGGTSFPVSANTWYHTCVVYDHTKQYLYGDGALAYSRDQTGDMNSNPYIACIGGRGYDCAGTSPFSGQIDEVRVYEKALSGEEVADLYMTGKPHINISRSSSPSGSYSVVGEDIETEDYYYDSALSESAAPGQASSLSDGAATAEQWTSSTNVDFSWTQAVDEGADYYYYGTSYGVNGAEGGLLARGFEQGLQLPFTGANAASYFDTDASTSYSGTYSLKHTASAADSYTSPYGGSTAPVLDADARNTTVKFSIYAKASSESASNAQMYIFCLDSSYTFSTYGFGYEYKTVSTSWGEYSMTHTCPGGTEYVSVRVDNELGAAGTIYWDNPQFFEVKNHTVTSGLDGYAYACDQSSGTDPTGKDLEENETTQTCSSFSDGVNYFHLRSIDNEGNLGTTLTSSGYWVCTDADGIVDSDDDDGDPAVSLTDADNTCACSATDAQGPDRCDPGVDGTGNGVCVNDGGAYDCDTSGEVVKDGSTYYADCTDHVGAECDSDGGTTYSQDGYCLSDGSCDSGCAGSPSGDQFKITDSSDNVVATIDESGDMFVDGDVYESQGSLNPSAGSFIIQNITGDVVAYISDSGDLYLQGTMTTEDITGRVGYNLEVRDSSDTLVAWFDDDGNLRLAGCLVKNYSG